jgi:branched-chain amino acid transport system substrate-binding protein
MQEAYPFAPKPKGQAKDKWDLMALAPAVPGANQSLESIAPTKQENPCNLDKA